MQIKDFNTWNKESYSEMGHENPIQWMNIKQVDNEWVPVSYKWKCKDFLNDAVVSYHTDKKFPFTDSL
jgi:hypothetical protein